MSAFNVATASLEEGVTRIEASAGTGKTYTLAALLLRLIAEEDIDIGSILVTTFTIPATAELRDRIRARLSAAVAMFADGPGNDELLVELHARYLPRVAEIQPRLERALRRFDEAAIFTIHGFCQRLLQERAFESGVTFDAELITDQSALLREVADDFWRTHIYPACAHLGACALLGGVSAGELAKLLATIVARPTMTVLPAWRKGALADAESAALAAFGDVEEAWANGADEVRAIFAGASTWAKEKMNKPEVVTAALAGLERCLSEPCAVLEDYAALDFLRQENVAAQTAKKAAKSPEHALFAACSRLCVARDAWVLALRREFIAWAPAELAARKLARNVQSFDDLLTRLRTALRSDSGGALGAATRQRFRVALIDEFQDTDPVQAEIFAQLFAGSGRLYFIGDPKQAIYGFRGADVFSYLRAVSGAAHEHRLEANQRSVTPLVAAVNAVFRDGSSSFVIDGIDFHDTTAAGRRDAEVLPNEAPFTFRLWSDSKPVTAQAAEQRLPTVIADEIVQQLAGKNGRTPPLVPSDFAVLTASNDQARAVHASITGAGLPAVVLSNESIFCTPDAEDMLALLTALAQPAREDVLRAALATSALGYDATALAALEEDGPAWDRVLERFSGHHADWIADGFFAAFRRFLVAWEVRPRLLAQPDGERRLTNLLHLAEVLHHVVAAQRLGPAAVAQWLAAQMHPGLRANEEHEQRLESDENAVKILTVHKCKGLEFNIVWVPFSWGKADLRSKELITFHDEKSGALTLDLGTPEYAAHQALAERERLAEHVRLLYVALTRARWQTHFVWGRFNGCENSAAAWVLHPPGVDAATAVPALRARKLDDGTLRADIARLETGTPGSFSVSELPEPQHRRFAAPRTGPRPRQPRKFAAAIPRDWAIRSYTSLTAELSADLPDYDRAPPTPAPVTGPLAGIHAFPRGRRVGTCLHEIFEHLDFRNAAESDGVVAHRLNLSGFDSAEARAAVGACVRGTLEVELAPGLRLSDLPLGARLNEVEFHLPVGRLTPQGLRNLLGEDLSFTAFRGFLKGFIDLIFEHGGRFYIADWKSNWLGESTSAYTPEAIAAEMRRHHYSVQYHLYTVALHRFLAARVPGYEPARHFGGVFYIFLRGIDPARPELGIFRDTPSAERIAELEALLTETR